MFLQTPNIFTFYNIFETIYDVVYHTPYTNYKNH
jgi:hypothetical protein